MRTLTPGQGFQRGRPDEKRCTMQGSRMSELVIRRWNGKRCQCDFNLRFIRSRGGDGLVLLLIDWRHGLEDGKKDREE